MSEVQKFASLNRLAGEGVVSLDILVSSRNFVFEHIRRTQRFRSQQMRQRVAPLMVLANRLIPLFYLLEVLAL